MITRTHAHFAVHINYFKHNLKCFLQVLFYVTFNYFEIKLFEIKFYLIILK